MNLCIVNEDHPQWNVPRKAIKDCQGKGQGALLLRQWPCCPFSSTGLSSPCEFVSSQPQHCRHCRPVPASETHPPSYRSGSIDSLGPNARAVSKGGGDAEGLSSAYPVPSGFRALTRLNSSLCFSSWILLSGRGFEASSLLCTIKQFSVHGKTLLCNNINALT